MAELYRQRYNGLTSALGAAITTTGQTSITFASALLAMGANIPTLTTDQYVALTIDNEILYLTAYTTGATSGTISRGKEGTAAGTHSNGATILHSPTVLDFFDWTYQAKTASFTAASNVFYSVDATAGNVVVTAPAGGRFGIKRIDGTANTVTVDPPGAVTIDGDTTATYIAQYTSTTFISDGTNWLIESAYKEGQTGATGATGSTGATGATGPSGSGGLLTAYAKGVLLVGTGVNRLYNDSGSTVTIRSVRVSVVTAPAGSATVFDVNLNGTTIFTTQANRPSIASGSLTSGAVVPDTTTWPNGQYLTLDIDSIGSGYAGADATLQIGLV